MNKKKKNGNKVVSNLKSFWTYKKQELVEYRKNYYKMWKDTSQ